MYINCASFPPSQPPLPFVSASFAPRKCIHTPLLSPVPTHPAILLAPVYLQAPPTDKDCTDLDHALHVAFSCCATKPAHSTVPNSLLTYYRACPSGPTVGRDLPSSSPRHTSHRSRSAGILLEPQAIMQRHSHHQQNHLQSVPEARQLCALRVCGRRVVELVYRSALGHDHASPSVANTK
jgi:hypothetical protein